eukprot:gene9042-13998_t
MVCLFDAVVSAAPLALLLVPWQLPALAAAVLAGVLAVNEVLVRCRLRRWCWEGKTVCLVRCVAERESSTASGVNGSEGCSLLFEALLDCVGEAGAAVVPDVSPSIDALVIDLTQVTPSPSQKPYTGLVDLAEPGMKRAQQVLPIAAIREFLAETSPAAAAAAGPPRRRAILVALPSFRAFSGADGYPLTAAAWTAFGYLEGLRAELRQTHPHVFLRVLLSPSMQCWRRVRSAAAAGLPAAAACDSRRPVDFSGRGLAEAPPPPACPPRQ